MHKTDAFNTVKFEELRDDVPKASDLDGFWENVPEYDGGYILTSRVAGV